MAKTQYITHSQVRHIVDEIKDSYSNLTIKFTYCIKEDKTVGYKFFIFSDYNDCYTNVLIYNPVANDFTWKHEDRESPLWVHFIMFNIEREMKALMEGKVN